jgi:hypothetical protein
MMSNKPTLDEILGDYPLDMTHADFKQQLTQLIADIIGEDVVYDPEKFAASQVEAMNFVKKMQRQRASERGIKL